MAVSDLITSLRTRRAAATRGAVQLAVAAVNGETVSEGELDNALLAAGMTADEFEDTVERLQRRKAAQQAVESERFEPGIEKANAERLKASKHLEKMQAKLAEAEAAVRSAHEELSRASGKATGLAAERDALVREKRNVFSETGGGHEWHTFGEPTATAKHDEHDEPQRSVGGTFGETSVSLSGSI